MEGTRPLRGSYDANSPSTTPVNSSDGKLLPILFRITLSGSLHTPPLVPNSRCLLRATRSYTQSLTHRGTNTPMKNNTACTTTRENERESKNKEGRETT